MKYLVVLAVVAVIGVAVAQVETKPEAAGDGAAASTTAETPDGGAGPSRKPLQDEILRKLLQSQEAPRLIGPTDPGRSETSDPGEEARGVSPSSPLLLEGTLIVDRPGRVLLSDGKAEFTFLLPDTQRTLTMELERNSLREALEREAQAGASEFVVTAEVTRYRGRNYLVLRKVVQRVNNGNLAP